MTALVITLALAPWRPNASISRWMPTSTPYAAQEIAMVSSTPAGSGLPIGLMPGALPSDHASRQTLKTTAMRFFFGHSQFGLFIGDAPSRLFRPAGSVAKLKHDPEKCEAVFRNDHAQTKSQSWM